MLSYDPLNPAITKDPYPYYAALRDQDPVKFIPSMEAYTVARWADVAKTLSDTKVYSSAKFWPALLGEYDPVPEGPPIISLDPPDHVPIRKLSAKIFVPSRVTLLQNQVVRIANDLIDDIVRRHGSEGEFDFVEEFSSLFPATVISELLGVDVERRVEFKHWVDDLLSAAGRASFPPERLAQIERSSKSTRAYFEEMYDRRSKEPADDLMSGFIHAEVNGQRMSRIEVLNLGILLLLGGVETTANLLGITTSQFKIRPEVLAGVRSSPDKIPLIIEEVLRYDSPVQMLFRHTTGDTELAGTTLPQRGPVLSLLGP